jgi:hypothetical protein
MTKLVCINMVRDVSDIIELWFRHHQNIFDHFYILDNNSSDATPIIIEKLKAEGFPITLAHEPSTSYEEAEVLTKALWWAADQADWFMFLDVDEFLDVDRKTLIETFEKVPPNLIPKLQWKTWIPTQLDYQHSLTNFRSLKSEHPIYKVAIDRNRAKQGRLDMGTHDFFFNKSGKKTDSLYCGLRLNHFPIRSVDQTLSKIILFNHIFQKRSKKFKHVTISQDLYKVVKAANFKIDLPLLQRIAGGYNLTNEIETISDVFKDHPIKYKELAKIDLVASLAKELELSV